MRVKFVAEINIAKQLKMRFEVKFFHSFVFICEICVKIMIAVPLL